MRIRFLFKSNAKCLMIFLKFRGLYEDTFLKKNIFGTLKKLTLLTNLLTSFKNEKMAH